MFCERSTIEVSPRSNVICYWKGQEEIKRKVTRLGRKAVTFYFANACKAGKCCCGVATVRPDIHFRANSPVHPCNAHLVEAADIDSLIPWKPDPLNGRSISPALGTTGQHSPRCVWPGQ